MWLGVFAKPLMFCHCKCTEIVQTYKIHQSELTAPIGPCLPTSALKPHLQMKFPSVTWLPSMLCFAFWVPSIHVHTKACTACVCKPSKMLWFYPQVRGAAGRHWGFFPFFSSFFFFLLLFFPLFAAPSLTWRVKSMASSFLGQLCQIIWCELMSTRA